MLLFGPHGQLRILLSLSFVFDGSLASSLSQLARVEHCHGSPYCRQEGDRTIWLNDCGVERPSQENFKQHKEEDGEWLEGYLDQYLEQKKKRELQRDEKSFPAWMAKRLAPNHPPSSMFCDGLNSCAAPSCRDLAAHLSDTEKRQALLWFEFISIIDHAHHAMTEATQDFFITISLDVDWVAKEFSYTDELQNKAIEKRKKKDMLVAIIAGLALVVSAVIGVAALSAGPILAGLAPLLRGAPLMRLQMIAPRATRTFQAISRGMRPPAPNNQFGQGLAKQLGNLNTASGGVITGGFIGVTNLMKQTAQIKYEDDERSFEKFLLSFKHFLAGMSEDASHRMSVAMMDLVMGGKTSGGNGKNLVQLYKSGFYSDPNVDLRGFIKDTMEKYYYAKVIGSLWQLEGVYIVESGVPDGLDCWKDTRGPVLGRVCLEERPDHTYYLQAITHYNDDKIRYPPGMENLLAKGGFKGLTLEDFVRSSLFQDEIWRAKLKKPGDPDIQDMFEQSATEFPTDVKRRDIPDTEIDALDDFDWYVEQGLASDTLSQAPVPEDEIRLLDHYGDIPAAVSLPICRSWYGEAISDIDDSDHNNAPCMCDAPARSLARFWTHPTNWTSAYTKRFIKDAKLYNMKEYGNMCHNHHDCKAEGGLWKDLLDLPAEIELPKEMEKAWNKCRDPKGHGHHEPKASPSSDAPARPRPTEDSFGTDTTSTQARPASMSGTKLQHQNGTSSTASFESHKSVSDIASSIVGGSTTTLDDTGSTASLSSPKIMLTTYTTMTVVPVTRPTAPTTFIAPIIPNSNLPPTTIGIHTSYRPPFTHVVSQQNHLGETEVISSILTPVIITYVRHPPVHTTAYVYETTTSLWH